MMLSAVVARDAARGVTPSARRARWLRAYAATRPQEMQLIWRFVKENVGVLSHGVFRTPHSLALVRGAQQAKSADSAQIFVIKRRCAPATKPAAARKPRVGLPNAGGGARRVASFALVCGLSVFPVGGRDVGRLPRLWCQFGKCHKECQQKAIGSSAVRRAKYFPLRNSLRPPVDARPGPTQNGQYSAKEVRRMAPEDACSADMLVLVRWQGRKMAVPLSQLAATDPERIHCRGDWRLALLGGAGLF